LVEDAWVRATIVCGPSRPSRRFQAPLVNEQDRIALSVLIRIEPPAQPNRIALNIPPDRRLVIAEVVVMSYFDGIREARSDHVFDRERALIADGEATRESQVLTRPPSKGRSVAAKCWIPPPKRTSTTKARGRTARLALRRLGVASQFALRRRPTKSAGSIPKAAPEDR